jgi:hypothetical protein
MAEKERQDSAPPIPAHLMAGAAGLPGERHTGRTRNFDIDLEC